MLGRTIHRSSNCSSLSPVRLAKLIQKGAFTVVVKTSVPVVPITLMGTKNLMPAGKEGILNSDFVQVVIHRPMIREKADELCRDVRSVNAETLILHGFGVHRMGYSILV